MFLSVNTEQAKNNLFPVRNNISIKRAVINAYNYDSNSNYNYISLKFTLNVGENLDSPLKIFNNVNAKKYMRIKVFEVNKILNDHIEQNTIKNILQLESHITNTNSNYVDIYAGYSFLGSDKVLDDHYIDNNHLILTYNNELLFTKNELYKYFRDNNLTEKENLKIGIVFYYDYRTFIEENNIDDNIANKEALMSNITVYNLLEDGKNKLPLILQDIRIIKKNFTENIYLKNIAEKEIKTSNNLINFSSQGRKQFSNHQFFSNLFLSNTMYGTVSGMFILDWKKLVFEYSAFKDVLKTSNLEEEILVNSYIRSIKILRKRINNKKTKSINSDSIEELVVGSAEDTINTKNISTSNILTREGENNFNPPNPDNIIEYLYYDRKVSPLGSIVEEGINVTNTNKHRTIQFLDKDIVLKSTGTYQYGVEIEYNDAQKEKLNELLTTLINFQNVIKQYLLLTDNIVKPSSYTRNKNLLNIPLTDGIYDSLSDKFTTTFCYDSSSPWNSSRGQNLNSFSSELLEITSAFSVICGYLGLIRKEDEEDFAVSVFSLLNCYTANINSISYCISLFDKIINKLDKLLKLNRNSYINIKYWFKNEFYEPKISKVSDGANSRISKYRIGYEFLYTNDTPIDFYLSFNGLTTISVSSLQDILNTQIANYGNKTNTAICSLTPSAFVTDKKIGFVGSQGDAYYAMLESDIRNYNILDNNIKYEGKSVSRAYDSEYYRDTILRKQNENTINNFSIFTVNNYKEFINDGEDASALAFTTSDHQLESNINPTILHKIILKSINYDTKKINLPKTQFTPIDITSLKPEEIPFQIWNIFGAWNGLGQYFAALELNMDSRINFIRNTIHRIEYLSSFGSSLRDERWIPLTDTDITSIPQNGSLLCRIRPYNSSYLNVGLREYELPIFNRYFLIKNTLDSTFSPRQTYFNNSLTYNNSLISNSALKGGYAVAQAKKYTPILEREVKSVSTTEVITLPAAASSAPNTIVPPEFIVVLSTTNTNADKPAYSMGEDVKIKITKPATINSSQATLIFEYKWYIAGLHMFGLNGQQQITIPINGYYVGKNLQAEIKIIDSSNPNNFVIVKSKLYRLNNKQNANTRNKNN